MKLNYAYRRWDDPYFWKSYVCGSKVYKFVTNTNGTVTFERVL